MSATPTTRRTPAPRTTGQDTIESPLAELDPSRRQACAKRVEEMPKAYRKADLRVVTGKASKSAAIKAHCLECVQWVRSEVALCTAVACPLYLYRPYQGSAQTRRVGRSNGIPAGGSDGAESDPGEPVEPSEDGKAAEAREIGRYSRRVGRMVARLDPTIEGRGLSVAQAAAEMGVRVGTLSSWASGESLPARDEDIATVEAWLASGPQWTFVGIGRTARVDGDEVGPCKEPTCPPHMAGRQDRKVNIDE